MIREKFPESIGIADQEIRRLIEIVNVNKELKVIREPFMLFGYTPTSKLLLYEKCTYDKYMNDTSEFKVPLENLPHIFLCNGEYTNTVELIERMIAFIKE